MRANLGWPRSQRGAVWALGLVLLALSSLMVTPTVSYISGALRGTNAPDQRLLDRYASDGGVEHALWRLQYEPGFQGTLNPPVSYTQTFNGRAATITVTAVPPPPPVPTPPPSESGPNLSIAKTVSPDYATAGQPTTFTYTLYLFNYGTSQVHLKEIIDLLPLGFTYVPGTTATAGMTFLGSGSLGEPAINGQNGREELKWVGDDPRIAARTTATVTFQATAILSEGTYSNEAWVDVDGGIPTQYTGPTSPVTVGPIPPGLVQFDITAVAGAVTLRVRAQQPPTGITIRSWQVQ